MDVIIEAFLQAAIDKVDILSIGSLSASVFWETEDPFSMITANLEAQGIAIVAPNGNLGNYNSAVTSPASKDIRGPKVSCSRPNHEQICRSSEDEYSFAHEAMSPIKILLKRQ